MRRALVGAALVLVLVADAGLAVRADLARPDVSVVLDVLVATVFVVAARLATGPVRQRLLVAAVGAAWLLGSWLPEASLAHQGVLLVALLACPSGALRGADWLLAAAAVPVAAGVVQQIGVAAAFAAVAVRRAVSRRPGDRGYPVASAAAVAAFMAVSWPLGTFAQSSDPQLTGLGWQALLVVIGCAFPPATRMSRRRRGRLADVVFGREFTGGLEGLEHVLAKTLGDPTLRLRTPADAPDPSRRSHFRVRDGDRWVARVEHRPGLLDDPVLARGVSDAVRLAIINVELRQEEVRRLSQLEASRVRLLAATDRTRSRTAVELLRDVQAPLRDVAARLDRVAPQLPEGSSQIVRIVRTELHRVDGAVAALLAGVPPQGMGGGGLRVALQRLAGHSGVPVTLSAPDDAIAGPDAETVLYYVGSEALANAVKHAGARAVHLDLTRDGETLRMRVSDDGRGGADADASGLRGLADRLAAGGGRLRVESPPGAGTVVTAEVPTEVPGVTRSSSTP